MKNLIKNYKYLLEISELHHTNEAYLNISANLAYLLTEIKFKVGDKYCTIIKMMLDNCSIEEISDRLNISKCRAEIICKVIKNKYLTS